MLRLRILPALAEIFALIIVLLAAPIATGALAAPASQDQSVTAKPKPAKKQTTRRVPRGVGFLPGYRTPAQIERQEYEQTQRERRAYYRAGGPRIAYWRYAQPQFYRGRWNGGDFGACYKSTPIGYMWTCGR